MHSFTCSSAAVVDVSMTTTLSTVPLVVDAPSDKIILGQNAANCGEVASLRSKACLLLNYFGVSTPITTHCHHYMQFKYTKLMYEWGGFFLGGFVRNWFQYNFKDFPTVNSPDRYDCTGMKQINRYCWLTARAVSLVLELHFVFGLKYINLSDLTRFLLLSTEPFYANFSISDHSIYPVELS